MQNEETITIEEFMLRHKKEEMKKNPEAVRAEGVEYITAEEYADKMHTSANTVRIRCRNGEIAGAIKIGKRWCVPIKSAHSDEAYMALLEENARLKATLGILKGIIAEVQYG